MSLLCELISKNNKFIWISLYNFKNQCKNVNSKSIVDKGSEQNKLQIEKFGTGKY